MSILISAFGEAFSSGSIFCHHKENGAGEFRTRDSGITRHYGGPQLYKKEGK